MLHFIDYAFPYSFEVSTLNECNFPYISYEMCVCVKNRETDCQIGEGQLDVFVFGGTMKVGHDLLSFMALSFSFHTTYLLPPSPLSSPRYHLSPLI